MPTKLPEGQRPSRPSPLPPYCQPIRINGRSTVLRGLGAQFHILQACSKFQFFDAFQCTLGRRD